MAAPLRLVPDGTMDTADDYKVLLLTRELNEIIENDMTFESDLGLAWNDKHQAGLVKSWVVSHADQVPTGPLSDGLRPKLNGDEKGRFHVAQVEALELKLAKAKTLGTLVTGVAVSLPAKAANLSATAATFSPQALPASMAPIRPVATAAPRNLFADIPPKEWMPDGEQYEFVSIHEDAQEGSEHSERWGSSPTTRAVTPSLSAEPEPDIEEERLMLSKFVREMSSIFGHQQLNGDRHNFEPKIRMWARQNRSIIPTRKGSTIGLTSEQKRRLRIAWDEVEKIELEDQRLANAEWTARFG